MIRRCYDHTFDGYKSYGDKGVLVSDELLDFQSYVDIVENLPNYNLLKKKPTKWDIDKDLKSINKKYSKDTLTIMRKEMNLEIENRDKRIQVQQFDFNGILIDTFKSISDAERKTGIHKGNISRSIRCPTIKTGGYMWREYYTT